MGATPSQHLLFEQNVPFMLQDDMGVVIALPPPSESEIKTELERVPIPPPLSLRHIAAATASSIKKSHVSPPHTLWGKRVLDIHENSPAFRSGLVPWLDVLVGCEGVYFQHDEESVLSNWSADESLRVRFHVFNIKTNSIRDCVLEITTPKEKLGLKLTDWIQPQALGDVFHVCSVARNSPAMECGLEPECDYLLGSSLFGSFDSFEDIEYLLQEYEDQVVDVFVYNARLDDVRVCELRPNKNWGDYDALFGADLAHGVLHRLPVSCQRSSGHERRLMPPSSSPHTSGVHIHQVVRTPEGIGMVDSISPQGETCQVVLDWGFGNDALILGNFLLKHVEVCTL